MFQNSIQYRQIEESLTTFLLLGHFLFIILTSGCEKYKAFQTCLKFRGTLQAYSLLLFCSCD